MELKDFVSQTLTQIIDGVKEAQSSVGEEGCEINPHLNSNHSEMGKQGLLWTRSSQAAQIVKFDVALTVTEGKGTKGGIGVFAGAVNLGSTGQSTSENSSVSRIQFSVPMTLPNGNNVT